MVSQRDLTMYLVAIKSVYSRIGEGSICIINDVPDRGSPETMVIISAFPRWKIAEAIAFSARLEFRT